MTHTTHQRKWLFSGNLLALIGAVFYTSISWAQLSGSYTINAANATSGTNFASFTDFASAINTDGASGSVTVEVIAGSGPYSENVTFTASGSATTPITINGNGETITASSGTVIHLDGADHFIIDNLHLENTGSTGSIRCYTINHNADSNTIQNSNLTITNYTGTSYYEAAYIAFSENLTNIYKDGDHGSHNVITNNTPFDPKRGKHPRIPESFYR